MVFFIKTPKVHRLSVHNLGTGNIAETAKTKRPKHNFYIMVLMCLISTYYYKTLWHSL